MCKVRKYRMKDIKRVLSKPCHEMVIVLKVMGCKRQQR